MQRQKKNEEVVVTVYAYVSPGNKEWLLQEAAKKDMTLSSYLDALITLARKGLSARP